MVRLFILTISLLLLFTSGAKAGESFGSSIKLPMTVKILDFQTTKRLCGQADAPHWCPAHLRKDNIATKLEKEEHKKNKGSFNVAQH